MKILVKNFRFKLIEIQQTAFGMDSIISIYGSSKGEYFAWVAFIHCVRTEVLTPRGKLPFDIMNLTAAISWLFIWNKVTLSPQAAENITLSD